MFFGWRCAYPTYTTPRPAQAQRRRAIAAGTEPLLCRAAADALPGLRCYCAVIFAGWRLTPCPAYGACDLP
ncbi:TPA: hypothetical protein MJD79_08210 [Klebsiella pneumoniae]|nr:hypothetical protein [Klebsiella pneumoniae]HBZ1197181.1 hypothetical protein [Klebsiella pneumoniae]